MKTHFIGLEDSRARVIISDTLQQISHPKVSSISFSFNHDPSSQIPNSDCKVLILWEPAAVMPWQYQKRNLEKFDLVIPMSIWRAEKLGLTKYAFHPYDYDPSAFVSPFKNRVRKCVMINSAKFSSGKNSLYGLRRSTSKFLHEKNYDYTLFGNNWQMSRSMEIRKRGVGIKNSLIPVEEISIRETFSELFYSYPEFGGSVDNKFEALSQFQISLVIENESDWVTEKIFDSVVAGTVPLYVGPDLSRRFPRLEDCVLRADPSPGSIYERLKDLSDEEIQLKKNAINNYMKDESQEGIKFWSHSNQWSQVANIAADFLSGF